MTSFNSSYKLLKQILTSEQPADWAIDTVEDHIEVEEPENGTSVDRAQSPGTSVDPVPTEKVAETAKPQPEPEKKPEKPEAVSQQANNSNGNFTIGGAEAEVKEDEVFVKQQQSEASQIQTGLRQRGLTMR